MSNVENYVDLISKDVDSAITKHNSLSTKERVEVLLHILDNTDVTYPKYNKFLLNSEALLLCIKEANKIVYGNDEELIDIAVEKYNISISHTTQKVEPDVKLEEITNNFYLLIKQRKI
jgi:hypothetical protein